MIFTEQFQFREVTAYRYGFTRIGKPAYRVYRYYIYGLLIDTGQSKARRKILEYIHSLDIDQIFIIHYHGYNQVEHVGLKEFKTLAKTIYHHYQDILNYFVNRSANASAESFNAKVKEFRTRFRGVKSNDFFLFRLTTLFA